MSKFRFELNVDGLFELMRSENMQNVLEDYAQAKVKTLGKNYEVHDTYVGKHRANVSIWTKNNTAMQDNLDHNTLLKVVK